MFFGIEIEIGISISLFKKLEGYAFIRSAKVSLQYWLIANTFKKN